MPSPDSPAEAIRYGPDIGTEAEYRLCGDVRGRRVLELGCGDAQASIAFALQGAIAIGVDASTEQLALARRLAAGVGVRLELYQGDVADLAFARADSIDLAFSAYALAYVDDVNRVFRQVHRVLKPGSPLVFSLPHPTADLVDVADPSRPALTGQSYFDPEPVEREGGRGPVTGYHHTLSELFMGLVRTGFRVDTVLEPEPRQGSRAFPGTLVVRARKEGA